MVITEGYASKLMVLYFTPNIYKVGINCGHHETKTLYNN